MHRAAASLALAVTLIGACAGGPPPPPPDRLGAQPQATDSQRQANASLTPVDAPPLDAGASHVALDASLSVADASDGASPGFAFDSSVPGGRKLRVFGLGRAACNPAPAVRRFLTANENACAVVKVKSARASGDAAAKPAAAFDGDACTIWNAGANPPQAIEAQLEAADHIAAMILVPEMTPPKGQAVHVVELSLQSRPGRRVVADATLASNDGYLLVFDGAPTADRVRVITTESESWVAWREIIIFRCSGRAEVPRGMPEITPAPARRIVAGRGACKADSDCAPDACCGGHTCLARSMAPSCEGVGCGQGCGGDNMACGRGSCVCERGTCAAWYHGLERGTQ